MRESLGDPALRWFCLSLVSRELRLPCIVSLPGITTTLKTGDLIEMDGALGTVRILES